MKLKLLVRDSKRQAKQAMGEAFKLIEQGCVALIGPASSGPTTEISTLMSKIPPIDRTIIGYSATSPKLSESSFSNFLRTPPADDVQAALMAILMKGLCVRGTGRSYDSKPCSARGLMLAWSSPRFPTTKTNYIWFFFHFVAHPALLLC